MPSQGKAVLQFIFEVGRSIVQFILRPQGSIWRAGGGIWRVGGGIWIVGGGIWREMQLSDNLEVVADDISKCNV
jgi:hypothetical protein